MCGVHKHHDCKNRWVCHGCKDVVYPHSALTVPSWYPHGSRCPHGALTVPSRCPHGSLTVPSRRPHGALTVPSRYPHICMYVCMHVQRTGVDKNMGLGGRPPYHLKSAQGRGRHHLKWPSSFFLFMGLVGYLHPINPFIWPHCASFVALVLV